jgi:4-aminobutyrate aminotransferase
VIRDEDLLEQSRELESYGLDALRRMGSTRAVRGLGVSFGVEVESAAQAERVMYRCLGNGLSFKIGGGNVITLCPPLTITRAELDAAFAILSEALQNA